MKEFYVINHDINSGNFIKYNIMPYLIESYRKSKDKPKTVEEFKEFIKKKSMYQWWSRCEYEIILSPWPYKTSPSERYDKKGENDIEAWKQHWESHLKTCKKIDVHWQVMMNLDIITEILMKNV